MSGLFVTSSGTGIGKTFVTCALLAHDKQQKVSIFSASKPIISGWSDSINEIAASDTGLLLAAQDRTCTEAEINLISPWRFKAALSPDLAAKLEGTIINSVDLIDFSHQKRRFADQHQQCHLIEGVGGVMCPLAQGYTVLDWIVALRQPCVLVVGTYLGALSHALTAISVLKHKGVSMVAVVINESLDSTVTLQQTKESLSGYVLPHILFSLPNKVRATSQEDFKRELARLYTHIIDQSILKKIK